jgi:hypothetical protein
MAMGLQEAVLEDSLVGAVDSLVAPMGPVSGAVVAQQHLGRRKARV